MIQIAAEPDTNIVYTDASESLTREDYDKLLPLVEAKIERHGKIRWYFEMHDFKGWKPDALLRDLKFDAQHLRDFEKIAMVGDKQWQHWLADLMKPFVSAEVKFFSPAERQQAKAWIES